MVAVKERLHEATNRTIQVQKVSRSGLVKGFKIYTESEKTKGTDVLEDVAKVKPILRRSYLVDANGSKSAVKRSENSNNKPGYCVKTNVARKVLADIGNVKHNLLETNKGKSSWPWKGKSGRILYPSIHKDAVDSADMEATSSKQPLRVKQVSVSANPSHPSDESENSKKSSIEKNVKGTSDELKTTKIRSLSSASSRNSVRNRLHETRKYLPVLKQVSRVESKMMTKECSDKSDSAKGKHGFPVKPSIRRSIASKPSNLSHHPWKNRASDGFLPVASRAETKVDSGVLSRKFAKRKTATIGPCARRHSSNHYFTMNKLRSRPDDLSKRKQEKNSSVASNEEPAQEEDNSVGDRTRSKSDRRNSFTSSLIMSTSKLKRENKIDTPLKSLPKIDNESNHLEVSDYVDDIYQYYWVVEGQNPLLKNYMQTQQDMTPRMRGILINWLIEVHLKFELMEETLFLTVSLLDRYLSLETIKKNEIQLVGLTTFLLASKYEDFWHPRVTDLISISAQSYTRDQMLEMVGSGEFRIDDLSWQNLSSPLFEFQEKKILKKLKFRLNEPTPYVFMLRFLKAAQSQIKKFEYLAFYLLELCLVEYEALNYKPSLLCAAAIYLARCTMQMTPAWTPLLAKHARYEESQIRGCSEMILKFHKAATTSLLKVVHEKYMKAEYGRIAAIKPLARFPAL